MPENGPILCDHLYATLFQSAANCIMKMAIALPLFIYSVEGWTELLELLAAPNTDVCGITA